MKTPPFLMFGALLFWGWETGLLVFGILAGCILESLKWLDWSWEFSDLDFNRLWDFCTLLFLGAFVVRYTAEAPPANAFVFFHWLPLLVFPMMLGQALSARDKIPITVFSWFMRRRQPGSARTAVQAINISWIYCAVCLISASTGNRRDLTFYGGLTALCGWSFLLTRPRRFSLSLWVTTFLAAVIGGFFLHTAIHELQNVIEGKISGLFTRFTRKGFDANETRTSLGQIGSLKQSGRVVLRVQLDDRQSAPLLRQATYDVFKENVWLSTQREFSQVLPESDTTTWTFLTNRPSGQSLRVFSSFRRGKGLLSLPLGTEQVESLPVSSLETNALGSVRVEESPGLVAYRVRHGGSESIDAPPDPDVDLNDIPRREDGVLSKIVRELKLSGMEPELRLRALEEFFETQFKYRLYVPGNLHQPGSATSALTRFLLETREGHCEYFATATVLLLRKAGVPARYATGYAVQERRGKYFVVRERHAHAWALAFVNGVWRTVDNTPGGWSAIEAGEASLWEPVRDWWSAVAFQFSKWRWLGEKETLTRFAPWVIALLLVGLARRFFKGRNRNRRVEPGAIPQPPSAGGDSEFYQIERHVARAGFPRARTESWGQWAVKARSNGVSRPLAEGLGPILALHYRYRFDPAGLPEAERRQLREEVESWMKARGSTRTPS